MKPPLLSVLVVDDHPLFREGLVEVVRGMPGVGDVDTIFERVFGHG